MISEFRTRVNIDSHSESQRRYIHFGDSQQTRMICLDFTCRGFICYKKIPQTQNVAFATKFCIEMYLFVIKLF